MIEKSDHQISLRAPCVIAVGLARKTEAFQIDRDYAELLGERFEDLFPRECGRRVAVKQHQRRARAPLLIMNPKTVDVGEAAVSGVGQGRARLVEIDVGGAREPEDSESDDEDYYRRKRETNQLFHLHRGLNS